MRQANRYQREDFDHAYGLLLACDRAIKTGEDTPRSQSSYSSPK